ncbi:LacI family DNA-binding transcriptional regulator [Nonomuraea antimicrobica]
MPPPDHTRRLTQRDIARLAGVSQTTVSLVLNDRADAESRIPAETRDRVLRVIRRPATSPTRPPAGWPPAATASSASSPTSRSSRARPATSTTRSWSASRSAPSTAAATCCCSPAPPRSAGASGSTTRTTGSGWPTAACCWATSWTGRT